MTELDRAKKQEYTTKATLITIFLSIFAAFISRLELRPRDKKRDFSIKPFDLILLSFSTLRLGRLLAFDRVMEPLRYPVARTVPDQTGAGETVEPVGQGVQRSLGQLISCPICAGTWIAAGLVYGLHSLPNPTRVFLAITSAIGIAEVLNSLTEALTWTAQVARQLAGKKKELRLSDFFTQSGGSYYVRTDNEEYYRQGQR